MAITHPFVSAIADGGDASLVQPSNWNADHTIGDDTITAVMMAASSVDLATNTVTGILPAANGGTGIAFFTAAGPTVARIYTFPDSAATILYSGGPLGTPSSGTLTNATGLPEAGLTLSDNTTNNASDTAHGFVPKWPNNTTTFFRGDGTYAAPTAATELSGITAASGTNTIANGDNLQTWQWAKTTNTSGGIRITESAASTGGTSTAGVPNQYIVRLDTIAASTASPLTVYSRAAHVFSVSPTTAQVLFAAGSSSAPSIAFAGSTNTGAYLSGSNIYFTVGGTTSFGQFGSSFFCRASTSYVAPSIADDSTIQNGLCISSGIVGIAISTLENSRFIVGAWQASKGTADAVSYAVNFRKSRGTVAAPTVITTGDDLATISGFGYVGATNTYQEACRITFDSTGTISDSATGIGGIIRFLAATVGAEPVECFQARGGGISFPSTGAAATVGNAVLVAGTVTVSTTAVNTADIVLLARKTSGGTLGTAITYTISDATSFTITSDSALDTSTFSWAIIKASG